MGVDFLGNKATIKDRISRKRKTGYRGWRERKRLWSMETPIDRVYSLFFVDGHKDSNEHKEGKGVSGVTFESRHSREKRKSEMDGMWSVWSLCVNDPEIANE